MPGGVHSFLQLCMRSRLGVGWDQEPRKNVAVIARRERMEGGAVEWENSLDSGQICGGSPQGFGADWMWV